MLVLQQIAHLMINVKNRQNVVNILVAPCAQPSSTLIMVEKTVFQKQTGTYRWWSNAVEKVERPWNRSYMALWNSQCFCQSSTLTYQHRSLPNTIEMAAIALPFVIFVMLNIQDDWQLDNDQRWSLKVPSFQTRISSFSICSLQSDLWWVQSHLAWGLTGHQSEIFHSLIFCNILSEISSIVPNSTSYSLQSNLKSPVLFTQLLLNDFVLNYWEPLCSEIEAISEIQIRFFFKYHENSLLQYFKVFFSVSKYSKVK